MNDTEKIFAVRKVLLQRMDVVRRIIKGRNIVRKIFKLKPYDKYYQGKYEGYLQAYDLLGQSIESIEIELEEDEHLR